MQEYDVNYMQHMGIPCQYYPMATMPQEQLEAMYPQCYYIINPVVERTCDEMVSHYGHMYTPTREQLDSMVDRIYGQVEADVNEAFSRSPNEDERQFFGGGRRVLRDLISILLIRNLIRRRRPFFGYSPFYGSSPFYGTPGIYGGYPIQAQTALCAGAS